MTGIPLKEGTVFDLAVLAANFWLVPRIASLSDSGGMGEVLFGVLLILSCPVYCLGAWLKRGPLGERLRGSKPPFGILVLLFVLMVMQYGLFIASLEFGWSLLWSGRAGGLQMVLILLAAALPPALTVRALLPPGDTGRKAWAVPAFREPLADLALGFSAVVSLAWWEGVFVESLSRDGGWGPGAAVLLTVLLAVPFAIFYLSPRVLLLAEDYRRPATWLRAAAVMLPLTARLMGGN